MIPSSERTSSTEIVRLTLLKIQPRHRFLRLWLLVWVLRLLQLWFSLPFLLHDAPVAPAAAQPFPWTDVPDYLSGCDTGSGTGKGTGGGDGGLMITQTRTPRMLRGLLFMMRAKPSTSTTLRSRRTRISRRRRPRRSAKPTKVRMRCKDMPTSRI